MGEPVVLTAGLPSAARGALPTASVCEDVPALLAAAAAGTVDVVLVGAGLPGLDRDVLARLAACGVGVVAVADGAAQARALRQLGLGDVRSVGDPDLPRAIAAAARGPVPTTSRAFAHVVPLAAADSPDRFAHRGSGRVLVVWGPSGAPGRTTVAVSLAVEISRLGWPLLLLDADPYGGTVATHLGLPDEASGLAAACRLANVGRLDGEGMTRLAQAQPSSLQVLSGIPAERWPELRPTALEVVLDVARTVAAVTVVDVGFCLEQDEELSYDTLAPRRNGATLTALAHADVVVAVGTGDPVGLPRLVRGLDELGKAVPGAAPLLCLNRVRSGAAASSAREELQRQAGHEHVATVPEDGAACDAALRARLPLADAAPHSPVRLALRDLACSLLG